MACDARVQAAAVAESVSALAPGDVFGAEGGCSDGGGFLEAVRE